jgi:hypothetical protein
MPAVPTAQKPAGKAKPKKSRGRPSWKPTAAQRRKVVELAKARTPRDDIAAVLRVSRGTLEKHCAAELKTKPAGGEPQAQAKPPASWTPTQDQRDRAAILAGARYPVEGIALDLGVTVAELRAACPKELTEGAARKRADVIVAMHKSAAAGNVSAAKAYVLLETAARAPAPAPAARKGQPRQAAEPAPPTLSITPVGKKAARQAAAVDAEAGTPWGDVLPASGQLQ